MPIRENTVVISSTAGPAGAAARKPELDDRDKVDFGAALGAMLAIVPPPPVARVSAGPAAPSKTTSNLTGAAEGSHTAADVPLAVTVADRAQFGSAPEATSAPAATSAPEATSALETTSAPETTPRPVSPAQLGISLEGAQQTTVIIHGGPTRPSEARGAGRATAAADSMTVDSPRLQQDAGNAVSAANASVKRNPVKSPNPSRLAQSSATDDAGGHMVEGHDVIHGAPQAASRPASAGLPATIVAPVAQVTAAAVVAHAPGPSHSPPSANAGAIALGVEGRGPSGSAPPLAVARLQQPGQLPAGPEPARTAALKIDLAEGASARASVRERAGAVEVRIVTSDAAVAQHLVDQVGGLRRAIDATGLRLQNADVSYRGEGHGGGQGGAQDQAPRRDRAESEKVFAGYEADK